MSLVFQWRWRSSLGLPAIHVNVVLCDRFGRTEVLVCGIMTSHNSTAFTTSVSMDM